MERQEINETVKESLQIFIDVCDDKSIHVEKNLDISLPPVLIDKDQVKQAINNLLSNAVDITPEGGTITVTTSMEELHSIHYVVIEVKDTGTGISKDKLNFIFEPFYTTKDIGVGTGLGLSICRKIIEEHSGLIRVQSKEGKGTSFKLLFPYQNREKDTGIKCWEFMKCGVEDVEGALGKRCPAYPNYGRICWAVAGTFCEGKVSSAYAQKLGDCRKCKFYQAAAVRKEI